MTDKFTLTFLGTGSAFCGTDNWQSNMLLTAPNGKHLLIDCGTDIRRSLEEQGLSATDIDAIYVSHAHSDHIGGLEYMAFCTKFIPNHKPPVLFCSESWIDSLWSESLRGGLKSIQCAPANMSTYFDPVSVKLNEPFVWEGVSFQLVQTIHIMDGFSFVPSFGLIFSLNGRKVFITTDTQHAPAQLNDFYSMVDVIFHDCETSPYQSHVHAHYTELKELPAHIKAKMMLYHYQSGPLPDAIADGFAGFVAKGQTFQ